MTKTITVAGETFWFDEAAARAACDFFPTYLRHTEGEWYGLPFKLQPEQEAEVRELFGWKRADGTRRYRSFYKEVPRKNGKTEFAAGLALLLLVADGEAGAQIYSTALDKDQAKIVFNKATTMVNLNEDLRSEIEPFKTSLYCAALQGHFKPLSSRPGSKHGFSPSGRISDEVHEDPDGELAAVVHEGMGARRQPMEIEITTAGLRGRGYGWERHEYARRCLLPEGDDMRIVDPYHLAVIFAAGPDDDWTNEAVWAKANPGLGVSPKIEFLRAECVKAKESTRLENRFRRFYLNQWTEQAERWLPMDAWAACGGPVAWDKLAEAMAGRRCYTGVDLSTKRDLTCLIHVFPPEETGEATVVIPRFFLPKENMAQRVKRDGVPYDKWVKAGAITATPGNVVDYGFVEHQLMEDARHFEIEEVPYDPWSATQFAVRMTEEGLPMVEFRQGYASMSEPAKDFEALVVSGGLAHGHHPVMTWNARNVAITNDPAGNIKPAKDKSVERIDGIVGAIMGLGRANVHEAPAPSPMAIWV